MEKYAMHKILHCLAMTGLLFMPLTACAEDDLYAEIKDTENFKKADAVFVGRVTEVFGQGPVEGEPATGHKFNHGWANWYAQVSVKKTYKRSPDKITVVTISDPYLEFVQPSYKPFLEKNKDYLFFGKIVPVTSHDSFIVKLYKFELGKYYFRTSKEMGTIKLKP